MQWRCSTGPCTWGANTGIEIDGAGPTARGAQLSTHVLADGSGDAFISAGHTEAHPVRTADGRRISDSALRVVWTQGPPPLLPEDFAPAPHDRPGRS
ncbi:hypothetical protein ABZ667_38885 [Streptomyces lavendulae]|uniref:hypothetical protein n=1 Tax=Streptomyces lavendulae TaxID=1914 RepID=UPI00340D5448